MQEKKSKIVDSFLFSEPHEKELLLLKFILENDGVDEWVLIENAYSFQGEYTGLHATALVESDERFAPYKHKLTIISKEEKTALLPKNKFMDEEAFKVEFWQRDLVFSYFINKYADDDWIFISDVDEMIDFSSNERKQELYKKINASETGLIRLPTKKFWYDFDNEFCYIINNAMCNKHYLQTRAVALHDIRVKNRSIVKKSVEPIVAFEYSSCFDADSIVKKMSSYAHTGFSTDVLKQALRCNHRPTIESNTWKIKNTKYFFLRTVTLDEKNSPQYVREHLSFYKTNAVDKNYKINRKKDYPELFTFGHILGEFIKDKQQLLRKKLYFLLIRLKLQHPTNG